MKKDWLIYAKGAFCFFIILITSIVSHAQTGSIEGVATDKKNKEALPGVTITLEGTSIGASADINGHFLISNLKPGNYVKSKIAKWLRPAKPRIVLNAINFPVTN